MHPTIWGKARGLSLVTSPEDVSISGTPRQTQSLFPHSVRKRPHRIPNREGERNRSGFRKRVSKEGNRELPEQPEVGWGQEENTEDSCPAVGFFPEFDFLIEVLPNFNSEKKKKREKKK